MVFLFAWDQYGRAGIAEAGEVGQGDIMKPYAEKFYKSQAWMRTREIYAASRGGLCERCLAKGRYTPGEIVHHKIYLTPENINDPSVTLSWENLELVCRECHAEEHTGIQKRYKIDDTGRVTIL